MNTDLKLIKKYYGEDMMHYARDNFSVILETYGKLSKLFLDNFAESKTLYEDLKKSDELVKFKNYIYDLYNEKTDEIDIKTESIKTPKELMKEAGYTLYKCKTEEDIQSFKKYYSKGEELCTFNGNRLDRCYVFFAVKKDVDKIKREDFKNPERQDKYGTSVISIQFTKDGTNTLSIKNRYNHRVNNPDATFKNNLDNIIAGLTKSFEVHYGIKQEYINKEGFRKFVRANDGKYYKYNYEIDNMYYCPNNMIIDNFKVKKYPKEKYMILDYFILDLVKKEINNYRLLDGFPNTIKNINHIEIIKSESNKIINLSVDDNEENIEIIIDKYNRIIGYKNNIVETIPKNFLVLNTTLKYIVLQNSINIKENFLIYNKCLEYISIPKVKEIETNFLLKNRTLKHIKLLETEIIGANFMFNNEILETIEFPKIKKIEECFLYSNTQIKMFYAPFLQYIEGNIFYKLLRENGYYNINNYTISELVKNIQKIIAENNKINSLNEMKDKPKEKVLEFKDYNC